MMSKIIWRVQSVDVHAMLQTIIFNTTNLMFLKTLVLMFLVAQFNLILKDVTYFEKTCIPRFV